LFANPFLGCFTIIIKRIDFNKYRELLIAIFIALTITGILFLLFRTWTYDDPFITYRYSQNLVNGKGLVFNENERILSTTTPFFALSLALLSLLFNFRIEIPTFAIWISILSLPVGGIVLWKIFRKLRMFYAAWIGLILYPVFPLLITTISSEIPLYLTFGLISIYFVLEEKYKTASLFSGLLIVTRPDGLILAGLLTIFLFVKHKKLPLSYLGILALIGIAWFGFAWLYYGNPLPVTLFVKQSQAKMNISQSFASGFVNLMNIYKKFLIYWLYSFLFIIGSFLILQTKKILLILILIWSGLFFFSYVALVVSRYFWYYAPLVPAFIISIAAAFELFLFIKNKNFRILSFVLLSVIIFGVHLSKVIQLSHQIDARIPIYTEIGKWIAENTPKDSTIGVLEVGIIGYYSDRKMIDFASLIRPEVAIQMKAETTYQDTAVWVLENLHPDFMVLREDFFSGPYLDSLNKSCEWIKTFNGKSDGFANMEVYKCK